MVGDGEGPPQEDGQVSGLRLVRGRARVVIPQLHVVENGAIVLVAVADACRAQEPAGEVVLDRVPAGGGGRGVALAVVPQLAGGDEALFLRRLDVLEERLLARAQRGVAGLVDRFGRELLLEVAEVSELLGLGQIGPGGAVGDAVE